MSVMDKLKKNSKLKNTEVLSESKFFNEKEECTERRYALTKAHWLKQIQQTPL